jgi:hypothetical protein
MDDISALRECWTEVEPPSAATRDRARTALLDRIAQADRTAVPAIATPAGTGTRTRPRWVWRAGLATVAAAALVAGLVVTTGPDRPPVGGSTGHGPVAVDPADTIQLAANYAAAQPFTEPRPDQWAYVVLNIDLPDRTHAGALVETVRTSWYRIDGTQVAIPAANGRITVTTHPERDGRVAPLPALNPHDYPTLAAMPTEPHALLAFLQTGHEPVAGPGPDSSGDVFGLIGYILRENVLPPAITAALLRAAALIPGVVQVPGTTIVDGRPAIAVGLVGGWTREDILLDQTTKAFLGSRSVAVADQPAPIQTPGEPRQVILGRPGKKGDLQYLITRGNCAIVDRPGQTH